MNTLTIQGIKNETYTMNGTQELEGLDALKDDLVGNGWEPRYYMLQRVITGRKKPDVVRCLKGIKYGTLIRAF